MLATSDSTLDATLLGRAPSRIERTSVVTAAESAARCTFAIVWSVAQDLRREKERAPARTESGKVILFSRPTLPVVIAVVGVEQHSTKEAGVLQVVQC